MYIRELTYRIQDQRSLTNSLRLIKELRKRVSDRESAAREQHGLISQDKLILSKNRNPRLADLFIRPIILLLKIIILLSFSPFSPKCGEKVQKVHEYMRSTFIMLSPFLSLIVGRH